jgi:hypothetical protein
MCEGRKGRKVDMWESGIWEDRKDRKVDMWEGVKVDIWKGRYLGK